MLEAIQGYTMGDALSKRGITKDYLAQKLKAELDSKEVKFLKVKKNIKADAVSKQIEDLIGKDGKPKPKKYVIIEETSEEMVIAVDVKHFSIRQRAREDAQKLLGVYPAEKKEISGGLDLSISDDLKETLTNIIGNK